VLTVEDTDDEDLLRERVTVETKVVGREACVGRGGARQGASRAEPIKSDAMTNVFPLQFIL
jgi:hypothetical protein